MSWNPAQTTAQTLLEGPDNHQTRIKGSLNSRNSNFFRHGSGSRGRISPTQQELNEPNTIYPVLVQDKISKMKEKSQKCGSRKYSDEVEDIVTEVKEENEVNGQQRLSDRTTETF